MQYNRNQEQAIKEILITWKNQMQKVLRNHAYVREIPPDSADELSIQKFKEDSEIQLAVDSCVKYNYLSLGDPVRFFHGNRVQARRGCRYPHDGQLVPV